MFLSLFFSAAFAFHSVPTSALFNSSFTHIISLPTNNNQVKSIVRNSNQDITALPSSSTAINMSLRAWQCSGRTNLEMIENLKLAGIIKSEPVRQALSKVDRANYADAYAYSDAPQGIGAGQTISAPHMHAHALEEILPTLIEFSRKVPQPELKVLDVGCGSGYLVTAFGRLIDQNGPIPPLAKGRVFGLEVIPRLTKLSTVNILKEDKDLLDSKTVSIHQGDGWKGLPEHAPFHAIHVGAAAETFPMHLMMQLELGGVMVIPVGPDGGFQDLYKVTRVHTNDEYHRDDFHIETLMGVRYVPLVHRHETL
jgi:protein-L-isoaspartate(D-aspartate) O-methyltransferase